MSDLLVDFTGDAVETDAPRRAAWLRSPKTVIGLSIFGLFVVVAIFGPLLAPYDPTATSGDVLAHPSFAHLLGTTSEGQDVLSQVLVGARESMLVGIVAAVIGESLAIAVGITADPAIRLTDIADGVRHNVIDAIIQRANIEVSEVDISIDDIDLTASPIHPPAPAP